MADNTSEITKIEKQITNYNSYASSKDSNGLYTIVDYKRADGSLYMKSTLSNVDLKGNYQTDTWQIYDNLGTSLVKTLTWSVSYDVDGDILSKVVA